MGTKFCEISSFSHFLLKIVLVNIEFSVSANRLADSINKTQENISQLDDRLFPFGHSPSMSASRLSNSADSVFHPYASLTWLQSVSCQKWLVSYLLSTSVSSISISVNKVQSSASSNSISIRSLSTRLCRLNVTVPQLSISVSSLSTSARQLSTTSYTCQPPPVD